MQLNKIQQQIFASLSKDHQMDLDTYIATYSPQYLDAQLSSVTDLTEEQGDTWITKAYLQSLA